MKGSRDSEHSRIISLFFGKGNKKIDDDDRKPPEKKEVFFNNDEVKMKESPVEKKEIGEPVKEEIKSSPPKMEMAKDESVEAKTENNNNDTNEIELTKTTTTETKEEQPLPPIESEDIEDLEETIELAIIDEIELIVKEDLYELEEIEFKINALKDKEDDEVLTDEVEKLKNELQALLDQFEKIKDKYVQDNGLDLESIIDDDELYQMVRDYTDNVKTDTLSKDIEKIEGYISVIDKVISVENDMDEIDQKIDKKLDKFGIRDDEFDNMIKSHEKLDSINDEINSFNKRQESIIKDLNDKVKNSEEITKRLETNVEYVPHINRLIESALMIAASRRLPSTTRGNIIKAGLIVGAVSRAANFIERKETTKEVISVKYTDYAKSIMSSLDNVNDVINNIDKAFIDIKQIKKVFKDQCEEYQLDIPEYKTFIDNLKKTEQELRLSQNIAKKHSDEFSKTLETNNQKIKRLESIKNNG